MKRIAVVACILEDAPASQNLFNKVVSQHKNLVLGRMGLPIEDQQLAVVSLTVKGSIDEINALTGKLGSLPEVTVKTAVSAKEIE